MDQHTSLRRGMILAGAFVLFAGAIGMETRRGHLLSPETAGSVFGEFITDLSEIQHFPNLEYAVHIAALFGGWIVAWRLARLAGNLSMEGLLRAMGWLMMLGGALVSMGHAVGRVRWMMQGHEVVIEDLCAAGMLLDLLSVGAVLWYLPWSLMKDRDISVRVRAGLLISTLYVLRHLAERQLLILCDAVSFRADMSVAAIYAACILATPARVWGALLGGGVIAFGAGLGIWWKQSVMAMVVPAPGTPAEPAPETPGVRRGRSAVRYGAMLLIACLVLPVIKGCDKDIVPVVYLAQDVADVNHADEVGQWIAILLPYVLGMLVLVRATARVWRQSGLERVAVWGGVVWFLAAGVAGALYASGNLEWLDPNRLLSGASVSRILYALGVIFGLACPVVVVGFIIWAARWAKEMDRRIRLGQLLAAILCFDWFVYWPILYIVEDDLDHARIGLWLSLVSCAMIAAGTLWEFPRSRSGRTEVEREFGPREGHEPGDRRAV